MGAAASAFDGLERAFPDSRLLREAEYRAAEVHLTDNYETARTELTAFIQKYPRSDFARQAQVQVARTYFDQGRYEEATAAYEAALARNLSKDLKYEATLSIALSLRERADIILSDPSLYELRDLPRSLVIDLGQEPEEFTNANTLSDSAVGERQRAEAMLNEAARQLEQMRKDAEKLESVKPWTLPQHDIEMAVTRALQGSAGHAITDLDAIARSYPGTRIASDAYYEIAEIQRRQGDLNKARESYNQASRESGATPQVKKQAVRKSQAIGERSVAMDRLKDARKVLEERRELQGLVAPADGGEVLTLQDPRQEAENLVQFEELAEYLMSIAEIDLIELDQPRLALREYQMVLTEFNGTSQGPRALFAVAWIYEHRLEDRARALSTYRAVLQEYPESPQARDALAVVTALSDATPGSTVPTEGN
jgi:TolA-binding protein